jgi:hypothetical protein
MEILLKDPVDLIMPFFVFQDTPLEENIVEIIPKFQKYESLSYVVLQEDLIQQNYQKFLRKKEFPYIQYLKERLQLLTH